jgi:hypothetical protein
MTSLADPIHAAIANHQATAKDFDARHARLVALLPDMPEAEDNAAQAALMAEVGAINTLVSTAPTTHTGLQAMAGYLREERQHGVSWYVDQTITVEGHTSTMRGRTGGVETLIARRTAALG